MKQTFVFQDGNSQKFWSIETNGKDFTVTYGKLGTTGQSQTKSWENEEKCQKEASKLIAEKTKKGYKELSDGEAMPDRVDVPKDPNAFEFTKEQKAILKEMIENEEITKAQAQLVEKFCIKHAKRCYYLRAEEGIPTAYDSHIGGIPYCPVGEDLPKLSDGSDFSFFVQINFEGVDLLGYPKKGIFQIFLQGMDDGMIMTEDAENRARYYEDITAPARNDIKAVLEDYEDNSYYDSRGEPEPIKIKLEKGWSIYPIYAGDDEEFAAALDDCEIYKKLLEINDENEDFLWDIFVESELFPMHSSIGGHVYTTQSRVFLAEDILLYLYDDLLEPCWCIWFKGQITDETLEADSDMA